MQREAFLVLSLLAGVGCSLLAPSDHELIGAADGAGGDRSPDFGSGGQTSGGERATSGGSSGGSRMDGASGGSAQQAGSDGDGEAGTTVGGADAGAPSGGAEATTGGSAASGGSTGGKAAGGSTSGGGTTGGSTSGGGTTGGAGLGGASGATSGGSAGQTSGGGRAGAGGDNAGGTGGSVLHCSPNPCARGTCSEVSDGYKCTCPAGWGGTRCDTGSCASLTCPTSAPCRVPKASAVAVCYPSACTGSVGLCMAENADGSGAAIIIEGRNADFNPLMSGNWRNRAKYFGYLDNAHGGYACVFPQLSEQGTPLAIPLGEVRTKAAGFGQSNSWPNPPTCSYP